MAIRDLILADIPESEAQCRKILLDSQRLLRRMRRSLAGAERETRAILRTNIRKSEHVERMANHALSGRDEPEARADRLVTFFELLGGLVREEAWSYQAIPVSIIRAGCGFARGQ
jgi:hypothetical protein